MKDSRRIITTRVTPELHRAIKQIALDNDITIQDYIVELITADVQIEQDKIKSNLWEELKTEGR